MKVALIVPVAHLEDFEPLMEVDFVLTHMVIESEDYRRFYKRSKRFKILDNSSWELKKPLGFDKVLEVAKDINASEVILPDKPYAKQESFELTEQTLTTLSSTDRKNFRFMAVPQGQHPFDLIEMYPKYSDLQPDCIGVTRFPCYTHPFDRIVAVRMLKLNGLWNSNLEHHLLGLDNPVELLAQRDSFRSVDTRWPLKYAVKYGVFEMHLVQRHNTPFTNPETRRFNPYSRLKWWEISKAKQNVLLLLQFAHGAGPM